MTTDYIIIGAGSAGSAITYRLAMAGHSVTLIEFGGTDAGPLIQMPAALSYPMNMARYDWGFQTEPEPHLGGRRCAISGRWGSCAHGTSAGALSPPFYTSTRATGSPAASLRATSARSPATTRAAPRRRCAGSCPRVARCCCSTPRWSCTRCSPRGRTGTRSRRGFGTPRLEEASESEEGSRRWARPARRAGVCSASCVAGPSQNAALPPVVLCWLVEERKEREREYIDMYIISRSRELVGSRLSPMR